MVDPAILADWLPRGAARRLSPPSKLAVAAARMAVRDAGYGDDAEVSGDRTSVAIGIVYCTGWKSNKKVDVLLLSNGIADGFVPFVLY